MTGSASAAPHLDADAWTAASPGQLSGRSVRIAGVLALLLSLVASVLGTPAANAAGGDFGLPAAETFAKANRYDPVGSTGGRLYVIDGARLRSTADGINWTLVSHVPAHSYGEVIGDRYVVNDDPHGVAAYPLPSGAPISRASTGFVEGVGYAGFIEGRYNDDDDDGSYYVDLATGAATRLSLPSITAGSYSISYEITETVAVRILTIDGAGDQETLQIAAAPLDGSPGSPPVTLNGTGVAGVGLGKVWYTTVAGGELKLCSSPLSSLSFSCEVLLSGSAVPSVDDIDLYILQDQVLVGFLDLERSWHLVTENGPVKLTFPAGTTFPHGPPDLQADGDRLLTIGTIDGVPAVIAVAPDGSTSRIATAPKIIAEPQQVALGGDAMFAMDKRPSMDEHGGAVWRRNATPAGVASESLLPVRATSVGASAGRLAVTESEREYVTWFDRGTQGKSIPGWLASNVSGPFVMVTPNPEANERFLYRADGTKLSQAVEGGGSWRPSSTLFGTKLVTGAENRVCVRDLVQSPTMVCGPQTPDEHPDNESVWGDWIAWTEDEFDPDPDIQKTSVHAYNIKTQVHRVQVVTDGAHWLVLGDGVLLFQRQSDEVLAWNFAGGATPEVLGHGTPLALDGTRAVWADQNWAVHLTVLENVDLSAPRLLGTIAPTSFTRSPVGTWSPQFDATKALSAGVVEIRSGSTLLRELSTTATSDGSIRGVTWDGRSTAGALVDPGTYTWTLRASATDGTGWLTDLDGAAAPTGTVAVVGVLTGAVPRVTGRPVYGHKLTAAPGSWGPAPVTLRYQWLRDGKAIKKATTSTYTLKSADLGTRISVRITGSKASYSSLVRTSGATSKVVPAKLTATPTPKITGTAEVGSTLRAVPGSWQPSPVALSYRWKRNGANIAAATKSTYRPTKADKGKRITVTVTGRRTGYVGIAKTSIATVKVA